MKVQSSVPPSAAPLEERVSPLIVGDEQFEALTTILASLIIRSPCFRHRVDSGTRALRERMGFREGQGDRALLGLNIRHGQKTLSSAMQRGKLAILFSVGREFIFGDGFMHNIHSVANRPQSPRCLLPLTPDIAIFYASPMQCRRFPKAFAMNLTDEETGFCQSVGPSIFEALYFLSLGEAQAGGRLRAKSTPSMEIRHSWLDGRFAGRIISNGFFGNDAQSYPVEQGASTQISAQGLATKQAIRVPNHSHLCIFGYFGAAR